MHACATCCLLPTIGAPTPIMSINPTWILTGLHASPLRSGIHDSGPIRRRHKSDWCGRNAGSCDLPSVVAACLKWTYGRAEDGRGLGAVVSTGTQFGKGLWS